MLDEKN